MLSVEDGEGEGGRGWWGESTKRLGILFYFLFVRSRATELKKCQNHFVQHYYAKTKNLNSEESSSLYPVLTLYREPKQVDDAREVEGG